MIHCLHGAVGHFKHWHLFQDSLGEEIRAHDLWELFKNSPPSLSEAAQAIEALASPSPGDILLGYSMGARLALHSLITSSKWRAAIIVSAHPGLAKGHAKRQAADQKWADLAKQDWQSFLTAWNEQSILPEVPNGMLSPPPENQSAVAQSFRHWSLGQQADLRPLLKNITCPVLWITGENDPKFTKLAQEASALLPHATHHIISDCGHRVPWEKPSEFTQTARQFLAQL